MKNLAKNKVKKLAQLYQQDNIWRLADAGKSVREITKLINSHYLPRSKFKGVKLSQTTIYTIIKKRKNHGN